MGNFILSSSCEFYNDDVTVTSFINNKYCDVATEILPQRKACRYRIFVGKKRKAHQIHFEMQPIYGDKRITKQTVYVWYKKMPDGQKFVSHNKVQSVFLQWHGQQSASFFALGIQKFADR